MLRQLYLQRGCADKEKKGKKATSFLWLQPLSIHLKRAHRQCTHQLVIHPDNTQVYQRPSDASQIFWGSLILKKTKQKNHLIAAEVVACPLDAVGDTAVSLREDSHSLSFAVSLYMPSIEIAAFLQRWMSPGRPSAGPLADFAEETDRALDNRFITIAQWHRAAGNVLQLFPFFCRV